MICIKTKLGSPDVTGACASTESSNNYAGGWLEQRR